MKCVTCIVTAIILMSTLLAGSSFASLKKARKFLAEKKYSDAASEIERKLKDKPDDLHWIYNKGVVSYAASNYPAAEESWQKILEGDDLKLKERSYYNLGNLHYREGELSRGLAPQETIKKWESAVQNYSNALAFNPDHQKAKTNVELVLKKLEELKKQQEQEQQQQQQSDSNSDPSENQDQNQDQKNEEQKQEQQSSQNQQQKNESTKNNQSGKDKQSSEKERSNEKTENKKNNPEDQKKESANKEKEEQNAKNQQQKESASAKTNKPSAPGKPEPGGDDGRQKEQQPVTVGVLSEKEAARLLESMKAEEGNFWGLLGKQEQKGEDSEPQKDW